MHDDQDIPQGSRPPRHAPAAGPVFELLTPDDVARLDEESDAWRRYARPAPPPRRRLQIPAAVLARAGAAAAFLALAGIGVWSATWSAPPGNPPTAATATPAEAAAAVPHPAPSTTAAQTPPAAPPTTPSARPPRPDKVSPRRERRPRHVTPVRPQQRRAEAGRGRQAVTARRGESRPPARRSETRSPARRGDSRPPARRGGGRPADPGGPLSPARVCGDRFPRGDFRYAACLSLWGDYTRRNGLR